MIDDPHDTAEQLDEGATGFGPDSDPSSAQLNGWLDFPPDQPVASNEVQVTEPTVESVASRQYGSDLDADFRGVVGSVVVGRLGLDDLDEPDDAALEQLALEGAELGLDDLRDLDDLASLDDPDVVLDDLGALASDAGDLSPEEAALHIIDDSRLG